MVGFPYPRCEQCDNRCFALTETEGVRGRQLEPLCCYLGGQLPSGSFDDILNGARDRIRHAVRRLSPRTSPPSDQALRNLRGGWFEILISAIAWNSAVEFNGDHEEKIAVVDLPNSRTMPFWELYDSRSRAVLDEMFTTLSSFGINMSLSNPDLLCISDISSGAEADFTRSVEGITMEELDRIHGAYANLEGTCKYDSIKFGIAVKSALRPDRRYQIIYEGSLFKAIISHFKTRFWDRGLEARYYGLVSEPMSPPDEIVFTNPSIDTIIDVRSEPRRAVDEIVACRTVSEAEGAVKKWLSALPQRAR